MKDQRLKRFVYYLIILLQFNFFQCEVKQPVPDELVDPWILELSIPDVLYTRSDRDYSISVTVSDPQGLENIRSVQWAVFLINGTELLFQDTLKDDGLAGDIIAHDGVYYDHFDKQFAQGKSDHFPIEVMATDWEGHQSNILTDTLIIVDEEENFPPTLFQPMFPDTLYEDNIDSVTFSIHVDDPQGLKDIDSVFFELYPSFSPNFLFGYSLLDNGRQSDYQAGDGIYSFWINLYYTLKIRGDYLIRFQAIDRGGLRSQPLILNLRLERFNDPPVILGIDTQETVGLSEGHFTISIHVGDPQGPEDIKKVTFNSTKPDGTSAAGNPFLMYDDGLEEKHGDQVKGDGWYSLEVEITRSNQPGDYRFDFFAEDQSGELSAPFQYTITVILD